jgi:hypothetical protein
MQSISKAVAFFAQSARESVNQVASSRRIILYIVTIASLAMIAYATIRQQDVPTNATNILEFLVTVAAGLVGAGRFAENKTPIASTTNTTTETTTSKAESE